MLQGGTKDKQEKKLQTNFVVTTDNEEKNPLFLSLEPVKIHLKMSCSIDGTQEKGLPIYKWLTVSSGRSILTLSGHLSPFTKLFFFLLASFFSAINYTKEVVQLHEVHHLLPFCL